MLVSLGRGVYDGNKKEEKKRIEIEGKQTVMNIRKDLKLSIDSSCYSFIINYCNHRTNILGEKKQEEIKVKRKKKGKIR